MIISRSHIGPTTTGKRPEDPDTSNQLGKIRVRPRSQNIPEEDQDKARTGGDSDEDLEERTLGVSIPNCRRHGGEPFIGVSVVFVLDDFPEMQGYAHDQGAEEGTVREERMGPGHPFPIELFGKATQQLSYIPSTPVKHLLLTVITASPSLSLGAITDVGNQRSTRYNNNNSIENISSTQIGREKNVKKRRARQRKKKE